MIKIFISSLALFLHLVSEAQVAADSLLLYVPDGEMAAAVRAVDTDEPAADTSGIDGIEIIAVTNPYKFRATGLIAPVTLVGLGVTGLTVEPVKEWNRDIRDHFVDMKRAGFDDYVQYAPLATPYVLKLCRVKSRHTYSEYTILFATAYLSMGIMVNTLKYAVGEFRPDGSSRNSFPSGHTATAFMGAELLRAEFWEASPWIGVAGYAIASTVGFMRVRNNRHWLTDVLAGAGIGILSVRIAYWTFPPLQRLFFGNRGNKTDAYASIAPYYDGFRFGTCASIRF